MPKITQGNRLYFYRLFLREIGTGNQVRVARFEEVLEADDILPEDCDCESATELLENLSEIVKITTFKKGRVFATLLGNAEYDEALAKAALPQDNKDARAGKSWKRKRAGKVAKPTKPRRKKAKASPEPEALPEPEASPEPEALSEPEASPEPEALSEPEALPATEAQDAPAPDPVVAAATSEGSSREDALPEEAISAVGVTGVAAADIAEPGRPAEASESPEQAEAPDGSSDEKTSATESSEPTISLTITYDPREDESVAHLYPSKDELPSEGSFSFEQDDASAREVTTHAPGIPLAPAEAISQQSGFPRTISAEVCFKDAMLGLLYEVLPLDVDPMAALDEGWLVARSTSTLSGSRNRVTFPLRYLHEKDGLPIEVTIAHVARSASGKRWELVSVNGVDASWEGSLSQTQAPAVGGTTEPLATLTTTDATGAGDPERELARLVHLGSWETALAALAEIASPERWSLPGDADGEHALLRAYLAATFHRVRREEKVAHAEDGTFAAFDTGLLAPMGESVYACLSARREGPSWALEGFCVNGAGELGARLANKLPALPERASYLDGLASVALSTTARVDADPSALLHELGRIGHPGEVGKDSRGSEVDEEELAIAIERSVARARASFRLGTPAYDAASDEAKLLIPLCLFGSARACGAIVLSPEQESSEGAGASVSDDGGQASGHYRAEKIVSLKRAYACARVISQEQPRWLSPAAEE